MDTRIENDVLGDTRTVGFGQEDRKFSNSMRLSRPHRGKYLRLTAKILDLGYAYLSSFSLPKIAERFLEEVILETKESSSASVLDGHEIVYVANVQTRRTMSVSFGIGSRPSWFSFRGMG